MLDQSTIEGLREIISDYPFFAAARMLYLRNLLNVNSYKFESELAKHALFIPDRRKLFVLLNSNTTKTGAFELLPFDSSAFNQFFDNASPNEVNEFEYQQLPRFNLIDNENENQINSKTYSNDLIDKFINENPTITPAKLVERNAVGTVNTNDEPVSDDIITDTLARIYVKQGLYNEALNAYEKLILKFPEKNTYFASQIEKINKLKSKKI